MIANIKARESEATPRAIDIRCETAGTSALVDVKVMTMNYDVMKSIGI